MLHEADVRLEIYHMAQALGTWPIHSRDAMVCTRCGTPIVNFEQGRPDLIGLNPLGPGFVIECKVVNLQTKKSFAFADLKPEQRKWLNAWQAVGGKGYIGFGTVGVMPREAWLIDWVTWKSLEALADLTGKKSVGIPRLQEDYKPWQLKRITGGWELPENHSLFKLVPKKEVENGN